MDINLSSAKAFGLQSIYFIQFNSVASCPGAEKLSYGALWATASLPYVSHSCRS